LLTTYTTVNGTIANTNPIVLDAYGRTPSEIWMQTGYSYKFVIQTADTVTLQTLDNLYPILQNAPAVSATFSAGMIIIWSGSLGSIPSGWVLCDGTNSTPDLRNRFVIAAGDTYAVGATGGSANAIVVSHTHTATSTDSGHTHVMSENNARPVTGTSALYAALDAGVPGTSSTQAGFANISTTIVSAGTSGTNANLPPYYALAYIMKT
jgi:microcystin-dependent protein